MRNIDTCCLYIDPVLSFYMKARDPATGEPANQRDTALTEAQAAPGGEVWKNVMFGVETTGLVNVFLPFTDADMGLTYEGAGQLKLTGHTGYKHYTKEELVKVLKALPAQVKGYASQLASHHTLKSVKAALPVIRLVNSVPPDLYVILAGLHGKEIDVRVADPAVLKLLQERTPLRLAS